MVTKTAKNLEDRNSRILHILILIIMNEKNFTISDSSLYSKLKINQLIVNEFDPFWKKLKHHISKVDFIESKKIAEDRTYEGKSKQTKKVYPRYWSIKKMSIDQVRLFTNWLLYVCSKGERSAYLKTKFCKFHKIKDVILWHNYVNQFTGSLQALGGSAIRSKDKELLNINKNKILDYLDSIKKEVQQSKLLE